MPIAAGGAPPPGAGTPVRHTPCNTHTHRPPPPCLQAVNWLRRAWSEGNNAVVADEQGLGKTATVLSFLRSLRQDFGCPGPVLVLAPADSLPFWEGARPLWAVCFGWVGVGA